VKRSARLLFAGESFDDMARRCARPVGHAGEEQEPARRRQRGQVDAEACAELVEAHLDRLSCTRSMLQSQHPAAPHVLDLNPTR
jgi:hypothetical protein